MHPVDLPDAPVFRTQDAVESGPCAHPYYISVREYVGGEVIAERRGILPLVVQTGPPAVRQMPYARSRGDPSRTLGAIDELIGITVIIRLLRAMTQMEGIGLLVPEVPESPFLSRKGGKQPIRISNKTRRA